MGKCAGTWVSKITWTKMNGQNIPPEQQVEVPDGDIIINPHGTGVPFTGEHQHPPLNPRNPLFSTECNVFTADTFHIKFLRRHIHPGKVEIFRFEGKGTIIDPATGEAIIHGNVRVVGGPPDPGDTGTWESTRPGGGTGEEDEEKDKKDKDRRKP